MFIYRVTNRVNGKVYVGKWMGSNTGERWSRHKKDTREGSNVVFHRAIREHGVGNFTLENIYCAKNREELAKMEIFFIVLHQSFDRENGYNMTRGGDGGRLHTDQEKALLSRKMKGNKFALGLKHTDEWKLEASARKKGNTYALGKKHKTHPRRGEKHPPERVAKRMLWMSTPKGIQHAKNMASARWRNN